MKNTGEISKQKKFQINLKNTGEKSELENFFKLQLKNTDEQTEDTRGTKCRGQAPDREKVKQQIFFES